MQLKIEINLDNSAYENVGAELGENLADIIDRIGMAAMSGTIHDTNGNKTGYWRIEND